MRVGDNPETIVELAHLAEESGWDGVFLWDGIYYGAYAAEPLHEAWTTLAAVAVKTNRVRIGTMVTALARRKPWEVARQCVTLDWLSKGRLTLSVALGSEDEGGFGKVGEPTDRRTKAERLSEGLEVLTGLWSGRPFSYEGKHYKIQEMTFLPRPIQEPRIPIWVVAAWPKEKSMDRAVKYDGVIPTKMVGKGKFEEMTGQDLVDMKSYIGSKRKGRTTEAFDIVIEDETPGDDKGKARSIISPFVKAGVTWWLEAVWHTPETKEGVPGMRKRIVQGPPSA